jgi:hypothetical protein
MPLDYQQTVEVDLQIVQMTNVMSLDFANRFWPLLHEARGLLIKTVKV